MNEKYINKKVLSDDAQIVGENPIAIRDAVPIIIMHINIQALTLSLQQK